MSYSKQSEQSILDKLNSGMIPDNFTLREYRDRDPIGFLRNRSSLIYLRTKDLKEKIPAPDFRISFYVTGKPGREKDFICRAFARMLFQKLDDPSLFFVADGYENKPLLLYDGQPVVIWTDREACQFPSAFATTKEFLDAFSDKPSGICALRNKIHIISGQEEYFDFVNDFADVYDGTPAAFIPIRDVDLRKMLCTGRFSEAAFNVLIKDRI